MFVRIERDSSVPISRQLADQIRAQCLSGTLSAVRSDPFRPPARGDLAVNQNTVLRVYERLTAEKLLEVRHGDGTFVSDAVPKWRLKRQRDAWRKNGSGSSTKDECWDCPTTTSCAVRRVAEKRNSCAIC